MALVKHIPQSVPVSVYRASDAGAPKLTDSAGSLKTLLKTCLITGYGDKAGLGWQMADENSARACFYSADPNANGHGLMVDNANANYVQTYMMGGEGFATYLGYRDKNYTNFAYDNSYAQQNWLLLATPRAFALLLTDHTQTSQLLFFGDVAGLYKDSGNTAYINTSYNNNTSWASKNTLYNTTKPPLMLRSQYQGDGAAPLTALTMNVCSAFLDKALSYPDSVYGEVSASVVVLMDDNSVRASLPIFACAYDLRALPEHGELVIEGEHYLKVNFSSGAKDCFLIPLSTWEQ